MIAPDGIRSILQQYEKFGWRLQRVLLTPELKNGIGDKTEQLFPNVYVKDADLDAAWFTREAKHGGTAWELRALQESPFALIEVVDRDTSDDELESRLAEVEHRLRDRRRPAFDGN